MALPLIPLAVCILVVLWVGNTFLAGSDPAPTPVATITLGSQPVIGDATPRPPVPSPTSGAKVTATPSPLPRPTQTRTSAPRPTPIKYKVKSGDTLLGIAIKFDVSVDAIKEANRLTSDAIHIGDELIIPPKTP